MEDIPSDHLQFLKETLKKCDDIFLDHRDLWHIFDDSRLRFCQDRLPEARNVAQRIELTIHYLKSKENAQQENALLLFLHVLSERYPDNDERYYRLLDIIHELQVLSPQEKAKRLHGLLTEANPSQEPMPTIFELDQIRRCAYSVALIKVTRYRDGKYEYCQTGTGWLIAPGIVLTCWHVVAALANAEESPPSADDLKLQIEHMLLSFNHVEIAKGSVEYKVSALEYPLSETKLHDFAVLRLENRNDQPYQKFKYLPIEFDLPFTKQTQLAIIQHPFGEHQRVAVNGYFVSDAPTTGRILYTTPTERGTSGAPVLNHSNFHVVALHNGENKKAQFREGTKLKHIFHELENTTPALYNEIVESQRALNNHLPFLSDKSTSSLSEHTPVTAFHASLPTINPIGQEVGRDAKKLDYPLQSKQITYAASSTFDCKSIVWDLVFDGSGENLVTGTSTGLIQVWNVSTAKLISTLKNYTRDVASLAFSKSGRYLASGGDDGTIKVWHFQLKKIEKAFQAHRDWVSQLVFIADSQQLVSGSDDGTIKVWGVPYGILMHHRKEPVAISGLTYNSLNQWVASSVLGHAVRLWNFVHNSVSSLVETIKGAGSLVFSPDGKYLAVGMNDGSIVLCEAPTWRVIFASTEHTGRVRSLSFHPDSQLFVSGGDDGIIQLWDIQKRLPIQTLAKHTDKIEKLLFSPDGQFIASGGRDASIILWKRV